MTHKDLFKFNSLDPRQLVSIRFRTGINSNAVRHFKEMDGVPITWVRDEDREAFDPYRFMIVRPSGKGRWRVASQALKSSFVSSETQKGLLNFYDEAASVWERYRLKMAARIGCVEASYGPSGDRSIFLPPTSEAIKVMQVLAKLEGITRDTKARTLLSEL